MTSAGDGRQGRRTTGWDIGGAHLKAAVAVDGRLVAVVQEPCALWQGLDRLEAAFDRILARIGAEGAQRVTMTGELVDLFPGRREGVEALTAAAVERLGPGLAVYGGRAGWLPPEAAAARSSDVASANWHATAAFVGSVLGDALLIDIGSTTTDVVPIRAGRVAARGYSDAERLATGELAYTGVARAALASFGAEVPFGGRRVGAMPEYFATIADVWRILGRLPADADQHPTADGRGKSVAESRLRLSRMVGVEVGEADDEAWRGLAMHYAERQIRLVQDAAMLVLSGAGLAADAPLIACGVGRFVAGEVARRLGRECRDLADLMPADAADVRGRAADCAPAAAVALLA